VGGGEAGPVSLVTGATSRDKVVEVDVPAGDEPALQALVEGLRTGATGR